MKNKMILIATALLMSSVCTAQSYIDIEQPTETTQLGVGGSVLFLPDAILDGGPYIGAQANIDVPMGKDFVLGIRGDVFRKSVTTGEDPITGRGGYEQDRRLYNLGAQLSLDPGKMGTGLYGGAHINYLWGDFRRASKEDESVFVDDTENLMENQLMTGVHGGVQANMSDRLGLALQGDFNFAFDKLELPSTMSKVHLGVKFRF